jgi:TBC1 domain family member 5
MPDNTYFRQSDTQKMLLDILFVFCKLNNDVGYRQGMHELLAPILWVVERDAIDPDTINSDGKPLGQEGLLRDSLDSRYIEHDTFTLFSLVMQSGKSFYELGDEERGKQSAGDAVVKSVSPIVERSNFVHHNLLATVDPGLSNQITELDVLPQVFLIRWIRLLFGREFPFDELLMLWDSLFAQDPTLDLVNMICVAMLLRVRWQLMEADYSTALTLLLRYPSPVAPNGPSSFVTDALYLRDNLSYNGGSYIINKYSGRSPGIFEKTAMPAPPTQARSHSRASSVTPSISSTRAKSPLNSGVLFRRQKGLETILTGAAKGVYERSEKWGVNKAMRDAMGEVKRNVQGLQSPGSSPRASFDGTRRSIEEPRPMVPIAKVNDMLLAAHDRNKSLARMLGDALDDLQSAKSTENADKDKKDGKKKIEDERTAHGIDEALAKLQFVKVCLEDSSLPLPTEEKGEADSVKIVPALASPFETPAPEPRADPMDSVVVSSGSSTKPIAIPGAQHTEDVKSVVTPESSTTAVSPTPTTSVIASSHRPRNLLAQSSFAWMLGDDPATARSSTGFKPSTSPANAAPSPRQAPSRIAPASGLFGDPARDSIDPLGDVGSEHRNKTGTTRNNERKDNDGFNLATLKGGKD